jgi:glucose 1-dehydrogenase
MMRAIVTGASHGIGGATCLRLARDALARGEKVSIAACATGARADLDEVVAELKAEGAEAIALTGDLSLPETPQRLVDEAVKFCGGLDAVISNAGFTSPGALLELTIEKWNMTFDVNLRAHWLLARAAHPHLVKTRGTVVLISSLTGYHPHAGHGAYPLSKAALTRLGEQMALEWAPQGIRVNIVSPGMVLTPLSATLLADEEVLSRRNKIIPLGRVGTSEDIAGTIVFLVGPDAAYITGQNIVVDGGYGKSTMNHIPGRPSYQKETEPELTK